MRTLLLRPEDAVRGPLILVRRGCPLRERPRDAELMPAVRGSGQFLRREAARELRRLTEAAGIGEELVAVSGYRTGEEQARLFSETERARGSAFTNAFVARPGCSEHEENGLTPSVPSYRGTVSLRACARLRPTLASPSGTPRARRRSPASAPSHGTSATSVRCTHWCSRG